jgi:hypothetical protein
MKTLKEDQVATARRVVTLFSAAFMGFVAAAGCGGSQPKQAGEDNNFDQTPVPPSKWEGASSERQTPTGDTSALSDDQKKQMEIALRRGGEKASHCAEVVPDAPVGDAEISVIFDGKKGRITDVNVGAPWAGTGAEPCIKRAFIGEVIIPFEGEPKEVPYGIKLKKGGAAPATDKKAPSTDKKAPAGEKKTP